MNFWKGKIQDYEDCEDVVLQASTNPQGRHGLGIAKYAMKKWGAVYGEGFGLHGKSYAIVTKNLTKGFVDKFGKKYTKVGPRSVKKVDILKQIVQMYNLAEQMPLKRFFICYAVTKFNPLCGYSHKELFDLFTMPNMPPNVFLHESYRQFLKEN